MILRSGISLFTCFCLINMACASSTSVGLVMTSGEVQVDGSSVRGNAAIFSGNLVSSGDRSSSLQFADGTSAMMKPGTQIVVYREYSELKQGIALQRGVDKHPMLADGLKISGATPNAVALVGIKDASHIEVEAQMGEAAVWTASGNLVARVEPGKTLSFAIKEAAAGASTNGVKITGILRPHYLLTDELTNVTYQLQGPDLEPLIGASIQVTGTVLAGNSVSAAPQLVAVSSATRLNPLMAMGADGQQPGAAPAGQAPIFNRESVIFLIVIAVGGTLLGLAASGAFSSSSTPVSPTTP